MKANIQTTAERAKAKKKSKGEELFHAEHPDPAITRLFYSHKFTIPPNKAISHTQAFQGIFQNKR